jgi:hypothetical protein
MTLAAPDPAQGSRARRSHSQLRSGWARSIRWFSRIEAGWVKAALRKARDGANGKASGDLRLPVAVTTGFVSGGETLADTAIYDIGYRREDGGLLSGSEIELRGLSLVERTAPKGAPARLDAIWKARLPKD